MYEPVRAIIRRRVAALRDAVRREGSPEIQECWGDVEPYLWQFVGRPALGQPAGADIASAGAETTYPAAWWANRLPIAARCMLQDLHVGAGLWSPLPGGPIMRRQQLELLESAGAICLRPGMSRDRMQAPHAYRVTEFGLSILDALSDRYAAELSDAS